MAVKITINAVDYTFSTNEAVDYTLQFKQGFKNAGLKVSMSLYRPPCYKNWTRLFRVFVGNVVTITDNRENVWEAVVTDESRMTAGTFEIVFMVLSHDDRGAYDIPL